MKSYADLLVSHFKRSMELIAGSRFVLKIYVTIQVVLLTNVLWAQPNIGSQFLLEELKILKTTLAELHPDLYRYTSRAEFNARADSIAKSLQYDLDPISFYLRIAPLVTGIKNGHTAIRLPQRLRDTIKVLPLRLMSFEGKAYVYKDLEGYGRDLVGSELRAINNVPVDEIVRKSLDHVSVDGFNNAARAKAVVEDDLALYYSLIYGGSGEFSVEFVDGTSQQRWQGKLQGITYREFLSKYDHEQEFPWLLTKVDPSTALLTVRSFDNIAHKEGKKMYFHRTVQRFFHIINEWGIERLILDIRFNGGGELKNSILLYSYLASAPFQFTKQLAMASMTPPTYISFTNYEKALKYGPISRKHAVKKSDNVFDITNHFSQKVEKPQREGFKGRLVVLINGNTASAAGALASCVKNDKRGLIVGEENRDNYTGFAAGVPVVLTLPYSGITVSIPIRKFTYATGEDTGSGVVPDYVVTSTAEDFFKRENIVLNFAIEVLGK